MSDTANYRPDIFNVGNTQSAKNIILTPETGQTTDERWEKETPYVVDLFEPYLSSNDCTRMDLLRVLDFGCGIGRLSRELILRRADVTVLGIDISISMRALANAYVASDRFIAASAEYGIETHFNFALSVWALQHVLQPEKEVDFIHDRLKKGGRFFIINENQRVVPTDKGWMDDGVDLYAILWEKFGAPIASGKLDPEKTSQHMADRTYWAVFQK